MKNKGIHSLGFSIRSAAAYLLADVRAFFPLLFTQTVLKRNNRAPGQDFLTGHSRGSSAYDLCRR